MSEPCKEALNIAFEIKIKGHGKAQKLARPKPT